MRRLVKFLLFLPLVVLALSFNGCSDPGAIIDKNTEIENYTWSYANLVRFDVKIDNEKIPYTLYLNLRVTGDYRYSNIFVLIHQTGPDGKPTTNRYEFKLANADGEWLGDGSGNLYSYQMAYLSGTIFPRPGTYHFSIEQNMRDNPLHEVSDVGLRVEKAK